MGGFEPVYGWSETKLRALGATDTRERSRNPSSAFSRSRASTTSRWAAILSSESLVILRAGETEARANRSRRDSTDIPITISATVNPVAMCTRLAMGIAYRKFGGDQQIRPLHYS